MSNTNNGGSAFPRTRYFSDEHPIGYETGMTLRDYFAAKAMQGVCASATDGAEVNPDMCAAWSYEMADAMLKAREA